MSAPGGAGAALGKEPVAPAGGRRRRKPGGRERRTNLRMTEDEHDKLTELAAEAGVSIPRFLIESALGGGVKPSQRRIMVTETGNILRFFARFGRAGKCCFVVTCTDSVAGFVVFNLGIGGLLAEASAMADSLRFAVVTEAAPVRAA